MYILPLLGGVFHRCLLVRVGLENCLSLLSLLILCLAVLIITESRVLKSPNYCWVLYFSFQFCQFLLHVFCGSDVTWSHCSLSKMEHCFVSLHHWCFLHHSCPVTFNVMLSIFMFSGFFQPIPLNLSTLGKVQPI